MQRVFNGYHAAAESDDERRPETMKQQAGTCTVEALRELPKGSRLLGLDLGTKTIGLALSDVERRIATPLETIKRTKFTADAERLKAIAIRFQIGGVVIGLPLNMDGTEGPRAQSTRAFVRQLA